MVKCSKCSKMVTKKNPGLQCSKCSKWLHGDCTSVSKDQLTALYSMESVDWKCRSCTGGAKPKRLSCIPPDHEDEDNTDTETLPNIDAKQILIDIRREVREVIRHEIASSFQEITTTLQYYSDKIDDFEVKLKQHEDKLKTVENQCADVKNLYKNFVLRHDVLEQKVNTMEQSLLANYLEICGLQVGEEDDVKKIAFTVCTSINQNPQDIKNAYIKTHNRTNTSSNKSQPAIVVSLQDGCRNKWLEAAKKITITTKELGRKEDSKIYLRESLSPATAFLLWKTKTELKGSELCKYVWCKNGVVLVRKNDKDKPYIVRSTKDIERLVAELQT